MRLEHRLAERRLTLVTPKIRATADWQERHNMSEERTAMGSKGEKAMSETNRGSDNTMEVTRIIFICKRKISFFIGNKIASIIPGLGLPPNISRPIFSQAPPCKTLSR